MNSLLRSALEAHGGLEHWNRFSMMRANVRVGGLLWQLKQQQDLVAESAVRIDLRQQQIDSQFGNGEEGQMQAGIVRHSGTVRSEETVAQIERRMKSKQLGDPWDAVEATYFNSYALWTYLTIPFLYAYPGFNTEEAGVWSEDGETWRILRATFPTSVHSHARTQYSYFDSDGLLRRHRYSVAVMNDAPGLNYATDYRVVEGIAFPTTRKVYAYDQDCKRVDSRLLVSIELSDIHLV